MDSVRDFNTRQSKYNILLNLLLHCSSNQRQQDEPITGREAKNRGGLQGDSIPYALQQQQRQQQQQQQQQQQGSEVT